MDIWRMFDEGNAQITKPEASNLIRLVQEFCPTRRDIIRQLIWSIEGN